jgi:hypothetical protein
MMGDVAESSRERGVPMPNPQWGAVVDEVFRLEVRKTYETLTQELDVDWDSISFGSFYQMANAADGRAYEAARLARAAKLEESRVRDEAEGQLATMRESARKELAQEKADGKLARAPSKEDVEDRVRRRWPDKHRKIRDELAKMHGATRACEQLLLSWRERSRTLREMLSGRRRRQ